MEFIFPAQGVVPTLIEREEPVTQRIQKNRNKQGDFVKPQLSIDDLGFRVHGQIGDKNVILTEQFLDYAGEWGEDEHEEVLFESDEFGEEDGIEPELSESIISDDLPVLPLRGVVVYPMMWLPLPIGQERSIRLVESTVPNNRIIALVTSKTEEVEEPNPGQIHDIGTAAQVHRVLKTPDGTIRLLVQGLERIRILEYIQEQRYYRHKPNI